MGGNLRIEMLHYNADVACATLRLLARHADPQRLQAAELRTRSGPRRGNGAHASVRAADNMAFARRVRSEYVLARSAMTLLHDVDGEACRFVRGPPPSQRSLAVSSPVQPDAA